MASSSADHGFAQRHNQKRGAAQSAGVCAVVGVRALMLPPALALMLLAGLAHAGGPVVEWG